MGIRRVPDSRVDHRGRVLWDDMRVVVAEREPSGGNIGRVHVLADHFEHVCDGEWSQVAITNGPCSGCAGAGREDG